MYKGVRDGKQVSVLRFCGPTKPTACCLRWRWTTQRGRECIDNDRPRRGCRPWSVGAAVVRLRGVQVSIFGRAHPKKNVKGRMIETLAPGFDLLGRVRRRRMMKSGLSFSTPDGEVQYMRRTL